METQKMHNDPKISALLEAKKIMDKFNYVASNEQITTLAAVRALGYEGLWFWDV